MPHCQAQRCRIHGNGCWHHCFRLHSHRAFGALFATLRRDNCRTFFQGRYAAIGAHRSHCFIAAAPLDGLHRCFIRFHRRGQLAGTVYRQFHGGLIQGHAFRQHLGFLYCYSTESTLFTALRGNGCVAFRQCSQLPVFYFYRCRITAAPGNGFIRHIFGQYGRIQHQHITHLHGRRYLVQPHLRHRYRLYRYLTSSGIATICRLHGDSRRPGRHCFQASVLIYRYHAVIAAAPGHALVSRIFGVQFCYQLTGRTCCQLQSGLIQRYTLHRHLAHLTHSFCSRSGIATVNAVDIVPNAIGQ